MLPKGNLVKVPAQNLVMHKHHPAAALHPDILSRLLDIYIDNNNKNRRLTKRALLLMSEVNPINIVGTPTKPLVISSWSLAVALKNYNVEDLVPCMLRRNPSENSVNEIVLTDFFLSSSSIERHDEIARRIKAICMNEMMKDADFRELISPVAIDPKKYFSLPERRRDTLSQDIMHETLAVREQISNADKPLGAGTSADQAANPTENATVSKPLNSHQETPLAKTAQNKEGSRPVQNPLFLNEDK